MKHSLAVLAISAMAALSPNAGAMELPTESSEVVLNISHVFVPGGITTESEAYVVISGALPNGCFKWSRAEVRHIDINVHEIRALAIVTNTICTMMLVPFDKRVDLGHLPRGENQLRFINTDGSIFTETLMVE